jgi:hypothetical protein
MGDDGFVRGTDKQTKETPTMATRKIKQARYVAMCEICYSARLETNSKKAANKWCTDHLNQTGHGTFVNDYSEERSKPLLQSGHTAATENL